jgi:hypothetical protein
VDFHIRVRLHEVQQRALRPYRSGRSLFCLDPRGACANKHGREMYRSCRPRRFSFVMEPWPYLPFLKYPMPPLVQTLLTLTTKSFLSQTCTFTKLFIPLIKPEIGLRALGNRSIALYAIESVSSPVDWTFHCTWYNRIRADTCWVAVPLHLVQ